MEKNNTLGQIKTYFESALQSPAYQAWQKEAKLAWDFYDGSQWESDEISKLAELGQPAIVINKIAAKIDNIAGTEVAGRTRMAYRSRSGQPQEEKAAQILTDLLSFVAERAELPQEMSRCFRAGLVCGIGWLETGVASGTTGAEIFIKNDDELSVVWDPLAREADLSDARFVARERWLDAEAVRETELLGKQVTQRTQQEEERLAQRGLADSTAAQSLRRQRALDEQDAQKTLSLQKEELGSQIRNEKLALQQNLFNTASQQKDAALARTARAATSSLGDAVALNTQRQASILDYYNASNGNSSSGLGSVFGNALGRSAGSSIGGTLGGGIGGPAGSAAGSWLGSWLFSKK